MNKDVIEVPTLGDFLLRSAGQWAERDMLVFPDARQSYGALMERSYACARSLIAMGVKRGDHIGMLMPNCHEYLELIFATALIGGVSVPINDRYKARELAYVVENADLRVLFTTDIVSEFSDFAALLQSAFPSLKDAADPAQLSIPEAPELKSIVMMGASSPEGFMRRAAFEARSSDASDDDVDALRILVRLRDTCMLNYTSGTTANPKGCVLTHEAVVRNGMTITRARWGLTENDTMWVPLPMFHMSLFMPVLACMDAGTTLLCMRHFDAGEALAFIGQEGCTALFCFFPTIAAAIINHPDFADFDVSNVRLTLNVAPPDVLRQFQDAFPNSYQFSCFGLAENTGFLCLTEQSDSIEVRTTTCGRPLPGSEAKVIDPESGETVLPGEKGEILVRGYSILEEYYKDPEKTAATIQDGWVRTGDLGSMTEEGRIRFHGRLKETLKVGGENVAAVEIESFLSSHPAVKLVQIVGVPDERLDEVAAAFVELKPGASAAPEEFIDMCKGQIASFKIPRYVKFVEDWPMSATKIQKNKLAEMPLGERLMR